MTNTYVFECCTNDLQRDIKKLKSYMDKSDCKIVTVDVSVLNFIDAVRVCSLVSGYHYAKYIDGSLTWLVKDDFTKTSIEPFMLSNMLIKIKNTDITERVSA